MNVKLSVMITPPGKTEVCHTDFKIRRLLVQTKECTKINATPIDRYKNIKTSRS